MSQWSVVLEAFTNGFPVLISHFVVAVLILLSGVFIYVKTSAWNDLELIRSGSELNAARYNYLRMIVGPFENPHICNPSGSPIHANHSAPQHHFTPRHPAFKPK